MVSQLQLQDQGVVTVLLFNVAFGVIGFLIFCWLRRRFGEFYHPRHYFRSHFNKQNGGSSSSSAANQQRNLKDSSSTSPLSSAQSSFHASSSSNGIPITSSEPSPYTSFSPFPSNSLSSFPSNSYSSSPPNNTSPISSSYSSSPPSSPSSSRRRGSDPPTSPSSSSSTSSSSTQQSQKSPTVYTSLLRSRPWDDELSEISQSGFWGWTRLTKDFIDEKLLEYYGEDAYLYFYFLRKLKALLLFMSIFSIIIILPINLTGEDVSQVIGINKITMGTIGQDSPRLWAHYFFLCAYSFATLYLIKIVHLRYLEVMQRYRMKKKASNYTLLIQELPVPLMISNDDSLRDYASRLFNPFKIHRSRLSFYTPILTKRLDAFSSAKRELDKANELFEIEGKEPEIGDPNVSWYLRWKYKVKSREYYQKLVDSLQEDIRQERNRLEEVIQTPPPRPNFGQTESGSHLGRVLNVGREAHALIHRESKAVLQGISDAVLPVSLQLRNVRATHLGFVTFGSLKATYLCLQALLSVDSTQVRPSLAPEPEAVNWSAVHVRWRQRTIRDISVFAASTALIIFWSSLVGLMTTYLSVATIQDWFPQLVEVLNKLSDAVSSLVFAFLPTIGTSLLAFLLIPILQQLVYQEMWFDSGEADRSLMRKYYVFLLFNVILAASITPQIPQLIKGLQNVSTPCGINDSISSEPLCALVMIAEIIGTSLPARGFFFVNYFLNTIGMGSVLTLIRIGGFAMNRIKARWVRSTYEKETSFFSGSFSYATMYSLHISFFSIALTFSLLVPIMPLLGFIYVALFRFIQKFNVICVHDKGYERGGKLTTTVMPLLFTSLVLFQLGMLGLFLAYGGEGQFVATLILIAITSVLYASMSWFYNKPSTYLPLEAIYREEDVSLPDDYLQPERQEDLLSSVL